VGKSFDFKVFWAGLLAFDTNSDGSIQFDEFVRWYTYGHSEEDRAVMASLVWKDSGFTTLHENILHKKKIIEEGHHPDDAHTHDGSIRQEYGEVEYNQDYRLSRLSEVFVGFDIDSSGAIGRDELFDLGNARRKLGHKGQDARPWTEEQNEQMMVTILRARVRPGPEHEILESEFNAYFNATLPSDRVNFDRAIDEFLGVADYSMRMRFKAQGPLMAIPEINRRGSVEDEAKVSNEDENEDEDVPVEQHMMGSIEEGQDSLWRSYGQLSLNGDSHSFNP